MTFVGELLDWDSGATGFLGIFGATMTVRSSPADSGASNPNGRFPEALACIPASDGFVDVMPTTASAYVGGTIVVNRAVLAAQPVQSYRSFTMTRAADFGFDAAKAHVYVHVHGDARTVTTAASPMTMKHLDAASAWVDGNTGNDIYLGNIDGSSTTLTITGGGATAPSSIPLTAGAFTWVEILAK